MMFEGKHIHFSAVDQKPLCSYSAKLCKQRRINGYAFCIRHILEDKSAPFKQCAHVARYNKQKCTNPIPCNENREFCNSHMQVAGMLPKKERKNKKEKDKEIFIPCDGKLKFADRLRALLKKENSISCSDDPFNSDDPYAFTDPIPEQANGCIGFSSTSLMRTAWNCTQKTCDSGSSESLLRCDQPTKNSIIFYVKPKSNAPKLSKTMNRLHAKIAQNKILDKQKKTQDSSQNMALLSVNFHNTLNNIKSEPLSPIDTTSLSNESNSAKINIDVEKMESVNIKLEPSDDAAETLVESDSEKIVENIAESVSDEKNPESINMSSAENLVRTIKSEVMSNVSSTDLSSSPVARFELRSSKLNGLCSPSSASFRENSSSSNDSMLEDHSHFTGVKVEAKPETTVKCDKRPRMIERMQKIFERRWKGIRDLHSLGLSSCESDGSESEAESKLYSQLSWFNMLDKSKSGTPENTKFPSRQLEKMKLKSQLQATYQRLSHLNKLHKQEAKRQRALIQPLINAARVCPDETVEILLGCAKSSGEKKEDNSILAAKRKCCYKQDDVCNRPALPYTWHCQKHIMYNVNQLLFQHCTAKYPDGTQCCVPVFDVSHELPLCAEHAIKKDNYNRMALEPKLKKPRKKPKPSALTRPPKRGKKKKKLGPLRPFSPSPHLQQPLPASSNSSESSTEIKTSNELVYTNKKLKPAETIPSDTNISKRLNGQMDSELGSDLEDQFSPGAIEKSLELPLDAAELANQATKLLEEHDFTDVLNKIPDDAFNDLFVAERNGEYFPTKEETEELERALAAVSKDVHLAKVSLAKLSSGEGPDLEELERSIEIHGSLLGAENLSSAIEENTFPELSNNLSVMTSSFSTSDLSSLTQALSGVSSENIEQSHLPPGTESHLTQSSGATVPILTSDVTHHHVLNGHTVVAGLHPLHVDANFSHLVDNSLNPVISDGSSDSRLVGTSHFGTILLGLNQACTTSLPQTSFSNGSNISEGTGLMSTPGGLTSTHWLLNTSSDQVLTLSHMSYQNGFIVTSQAGTSYTGSPLLASVAKYPLQALSAEVSLVSSNLPLVTSSCIDSITEQPVNSINLPSRPVSLQNNSSSTVIAQEGAS